MVERGSAVRHALARSGREEGKVFLMLSTGLSYTQQPRRARDSFKLPDAHVKEQHDTNSSNDINAAAIHRNTTQILFFISTLYLWPGYVHTRCLSYSRLVAALVILLPVVSAKNLAAVPIGVTISPSSTVCPSHGGIANPSLAHCRYRAHTPTEFRKNVLSSVFFVLSSSERAVLPRSRPRTRRTPDRNGPKN